MDHKYDRNNEPFIIEDRFDPLSMPTSKYIRLSDEIKVKFIQN